MIKWDIFLLANKKNKIYLLSTKTLKFVQYSIDLFFL